MWRYFFRKGRLVAGLASALFIATAFQTGGCTVTIDEETMNQVFDWLNNLDTSGWFASGPNGFGYGWDGGPCDCGYSH